MRPAALLLFSLTGALTLLTLAAPLFAERKVVAYVPNWIDLESFAETIDYAKLTHVNVAFENPTDAEGGLSFSSKNAALIAKARARGVKVLISIGGGAASGDKTMQAWKSAPRAAANRASTPTSSPSAGK